MEVYKDLCLRLKIKCSLKTVGNLEISFDFKYRFTLFYQTSAEPQKTTAS